MSGAIVARSLGAALADRFSFSMLLRLKSIDDPTERRAVAKKIADDDLDERSSRELISRASGDTGAAAACASSRR